MEKVDKRSINIDHLYNYFIRSVHYKGENITLPINTYYILVFGEIEEQKTKMTVSKYNIEAIGLNE